MTARCCASTSQGSQRLVAGDTGTACLLSLTMDPKVHLSSVRNYCWSGQALSLLQSQLLSAHLRVVPHGLQAEALIAGICKLT